MARLVHWRIVQRFMVVGIRAIVPRHRIGIAVVAFDDQDRILMLKHVFHPYAPWGLPGGWLDRGESPRSGALRELHEETGLDARLGPVLHVGSDTNPESVNVAFLGYDVRGRLRLSSEILDARWFSLDALPKPLLRFSKDAISAAIKLREERHAVPQPEQR
jgi:ADP-ribose pyrophosphatase YjhB (NUDIX family)